MSDNEINRLRAIINKVLVAPSPLHRYWPGVSRYANHGAVAFFSSGEGHGAGRQFHLCC